MEFNEDLIKRVEEYWHRHSKGYSLITYTTGDRRFEISRRFTGMLFDIKETFRNNEELQDYIEKLEAEECNR